MKGRTVNKKAKHALADEILDLARTAYSEGETNLAFLLCLTSGQFVGNNLTALCEAVSARMHIDVMTWTSRQMNEGA
jgi:hypothetical protein